MIKYSTENGHTEVKFFIDDVSGSLCIELEGELVEVPTAYALKLLTVLKQEILQVEDGKRKERSRIYKFLSL